MKHIIREVPPESADLELYFDCDGLTGESGEYCYNLFIISNDGYGRYSGFNMDEYKKVQKQADAVLDGFNDVKNGYLGGYATHKEVMLDNDIPYNSRKCHMLKEWAKDADTANTDDIAAFLTITTGKRWDASYAHGYFQGDYVEMVYCPEYYTDGVKSYGEVWLGAAKEFCVIDIDEDGEEVDSCYGYIVADCEARNDEDYKKLVCEWADIDPEKTQLEMIDGSRTYTTYLYRTA